MSRRRDQRVEQEGIFPHSSICLTSGTKVWALGEGEKLD